jgi:protein-disulfide isomerase
MRQRRFVAATTLLVLGVCAGSPVSGSSASQAGAEASALFNGIPEHGNSLGRSHAPVTLVIFSDLQSPITGKFMHNLFPNLVTHWVRSGKVRVTYRPLQATTPDRSEFERQQVAALAAGNQNRAWPFMDVFYREQVVEASEYVFGYATEQFLEGIATQTEGLNLSQWKIDRLKPTYRRQIAGQIAEDTRVADRRHISGVPAFLIGHTGATLRPLEYEGLQAFNKAIKALLRR